MEMNVIVSKNEGQFALAKTYLEKERMSEKEGK